MPASTHSNARGYVACVTGRHRGDVATGGEYVACATGRHRGEVAKSTLPMRLAATGAGGPAEECVSHHGM